MRGEAVERSGAEYYLLGARLPGSEENSLKTSKLLIRPWLFATLLTLAPETIPGVASHAQAMLTYSYYSDQIIITTDERRTGPVDQPPEVGPSLEYCWDPPHSGDQVTVQLSFKRDGSIFGAPRVNYTKPANGSDARTLATSITKAIQACSPLPFTPEMAANIAGQVFVIRFIAP